MTDYTLTIHEFAKEVKNEADYIRKTMLRVAFDMATEIRNRTIRNIDNQFSKPGNGSKFPYVERRSTGALRQSVLLAMVGRIPTVTVGGLAAPYAAIQELGGIVTPKGSKYLTIPGNDKTVGHRAGEFDLNFGYAETKDGKTLPALLFATTVGKVAKASDVAYWLVKRTTIKANPYFEPAVNSVSKDADLLAHFVIDRFKTKTGGIGFEVKT